MASTPVLLATGNPAKAERLRWLLEALPFDPIDLSTRPDVRLPEESGHTFADNALIKATATSAAFDGLALASDGGVMIPALGAAWDAVRTGRAAGLDATDEEKAHHLLTLMQGWSGEDRRVVWTESLALADRGRVVRQWDAAGTEGVLTEHYDPSHAIPGFWVYSLWYFPELGKRYVDLSPQELANADKTWWSLKVEVQRELRDGVPPL